MQVTLDLEFDVEPILPETVATLPPYIQSSVAEAVAESGIESLLASEPRITYEQHLPLTPVPLTPEQIEMLQVGVKFLILVGPALWKGTKILVDGIMSRIGRKGEAKVRAKIQIDGRTIEIAGLSPDEASKVLASVVDTLSLVK